MHQINVRLRGCYVFISCFRLPGNGVSQRPQLLVRVSELLRARYRPCAPDALYGAQGDEVVAGGKVAMVM